MPGETPADRQHGRADTGPPRQPLRELTLGRSRPSPNPPEAGPEPDTPAPDEENDSKSLAARCRAKAEVARWAAERQRRVHEWNESPDEDSPSDPAMVEWADALTDAFYWACTDDPSRCSPRPSRHCGSRSSVSSLVKTRTSRRCTSGGGTPPPGTASSSSGSCGPTTWPGLHARIEIQAGIRPQSQRQTMLLDRLRSLCTLTGDVRAEESWRSILMVVEELIGDGMPPSNREVRDLLLPLLDDLPEVVDMPPGCRLVLREIDRYLATRHTPTAPVTSHEPTAPARGAARLLSGRSVVLIGGLRRPDAQRSLKSALGLNELVWVETKEHQPVTAFEPTIARPDVALVLLAIRWSSHAFGEVKHYCDRHGKPLVRLPGGYSANQVAAQILSQCSEQLGDR